MRRLIMWAVSLVAMASLGVVGPALGLGAFSAGSGVAGAAPVGYPPHTGSGSGSVAVGGTTSTSECGFAPGTTVTITLNGVTYGTYTADSGGCVTLTITTRLVGSQVQVSINGGSYDPANCGTNTIVTTGTAPDGLPFVFTFTLTVGTGTCTTAVVTPATPSSSGAAPSGVSSSSGASGVSSSGTSGQAAGTSGTSASTATTQSGGLAFTGSDIALTTIGGLILIVLGTVLLVVVRRRRQAAA